MRDEGKTGLCSEVITIFSGKRQDEGLEIEL